VTLTTTLTDGDDDVAVDSATVTLSDASFSSIDIEDDGPSVDVSVAEVEQTPVTLTLANLDESIGGDPGDDADGDGPDDDVPGNTDPDPTGTNPFGRVVTAVRDGETPGDLEALFDVTKDPGTDGEKSVAHALSLTLTDAGDSGVATVLSVTDPGDDFFDATISLFVVDSTTIEGRFQVTEGVWAV
jgi:hypothetical protein